MEQYEAFCAQRGEDPADVALAWLLHQPAVTAPIVGPRTGEQLDGAPRALEISLDDTALSQLDKIFRVRAGRRRRLMPGEAPAA